MLRNASIGMHEWSRYEWVMNVAKLISACLFAPLISFSSILSSSVLSNWPLAMQRKMITQKIWLIVTLLTISLYASESAVMGQEDRLVRIKRQSYANNDIGNAFIDSIFNIPISTLNSVGQLIKNSRPVVQEVRRRAEQQYNQYQENRRKTSTTVEYIDLRRTTPRTTGTYSQRRRSAAEIAGVRPSYQGSAYRI